VNRPVRQGSGRAYAEVIGDPIAHSKSPLIQNFWLQKLGIDAEYRACHVRASELAGYLAGRRGEPAWRGFNVTMPHKLAVMPLLDTISRGASRVGAVNCVYEQQGRLVGENTDVDGVLDALPEALMPPGAEVCIIGTGGAARAAFAACRERDVALVLSSSRNPELGRVLIEDFRFGGCASSLEDPHNIQTAEVIINATPLGMAGAPPMPEAILEHVRDPLPGAVVLDMVYNPRKTAFLETAAQAGCRTVDGLSMLIGQAATAFRLFFGEPAPREHDAELRALLTG
jgi:shikimate dehydrogenase